MMNVRAKVRRNSLPAPAPLGAAPQASDEPAPCHGAYFVGWMVGVMSVAAGWWIKQKLK